MHLTAVRDQTVAGGIQRIIRSPRRRGQSASAARLGFPKGDIPGVDVRCLKALYTFHFRDANTALINFDRVIYTFKRQ